MKKNSFKNHVIVFIVFVITISCNEKIKIEREYYASGNLKSETPKNEKNKVHGNVIDYYENGDTSNISHWDEGIQSGLAKEYYSKNRIKGVFYYNNGKLNGEAIAFYESGHVMKKANFRNGVLNGGVVSFFDFDTLKIMESSNYINFQGKEKNMGWIEYNEDGSIKNQESRVVVIAKKDTVSLEDTIAIEIELTASKYDSTYFFIGDYDGEFFLKPSSKIDTIYSQMHKIIYKSKTNKKGVNFIRGGAKNYQILPPKDMAKREIVRPEIYFEYEYFVQ